MSQRWRTSAEVSKGVEDPVMPSSGISRGLRSRGWPGVHVAPSARDSPRGRVSGQRRASRSVREPACASVRRGGDTAEKVGR